MISSFKKKSYPWLAGFVFGCLVFGAGATGALAQEPNEVARAVTPEMLSSSFAEVAKRVETAVVNIDTKGKVPEVTARGEKPEGNLEDLLDFLRRQQRRPSSAVGSGFIVDRTGYILTNNHVVEDSARISVRLNESRHT